VLERCGGLRLAQKPRPELVLPCDRVVHDLHRDRPVEHGIARLVDDAHCTLADELEDVVFADVRDLERLLHAARVGEVRFGGCRIFDRERRTATGPGELAGPG
jgi:hypothetical protein